MYLKPHKTPGTLIVFEGIDGSGKGTQIELLKEEFKKNPPSRKVVYTKEPGSPLSRVKDGIRDVLFKTVGTSNLDPNSLDCLFLADHVQCCNDVIWPALRAGHIVVSDRYAYSQLAYAGVRGGMHPALNEAWRQLVGPRPDLTVYLNGDPDTCLVRAQKRTGEAHQGAKLWNKQQAARSIHQAYDELFSSEPNVVQIPRPGNLTAAESGYPAEHFFASVLSSVVSTLENKYGMDYTGLPYTSNDLGGAQQAA
jgi:dTMP kinase